MWRRWPFPDTRRITINPKNAMLGLPDPWIALVFILCIASAILCVVYSAINWNRGDESIQEDDVRWAASEDKAEEKL
ncbi:MAG TPA: hypothetical protein PKW32_11530 [Verrucomicrobiota bacterium]|nr:hypothetical protein [Verrucomicrobiota bacterium]